MPARSSELAPVRSLFRHPAHPYTPRAGPLDPAHRPRDRHGAGAGRGALIAQSVRPAAAMPAAARGWRIAAGRQKPAMTRRWQPEHFVACFAVEDGRAAPVLGRRSQDALPAARPRAWLRALQDGTPPVVRAVDGVSFTRRSGATLGWWANWAAASRRWRALVTAAAADRGHYPLRRHGARPTLDDTRFNEVAAATCRWCSRTRPRRSTRACRVRRMVGEPLQACIRD